MKKKVVISFLLALLVIQTQFSFAQPMNGNEFLTISKQSQVWWLMGFYSGFMVPENIRVLINVPKEATHAQVQSVVLKYINDHPEIRHFSMERVAIEALGAYFPASR